MKIGCSMKSQTSSKLLLKKLFYLFFFFNFVSFLFFIFGVLLLFFCGSCITAVLKRRSLKRNGNFVLCACAGANYLRAQACEYAVD